MPRPAARPARRSRFRRLAWKLTVSHTLTIVAAFVLLELLLVTVLYALLLVNAVETLRVAPGALAAQAEALAPVGRGPAALRAALAELDTLAEPESGKVVAVPRSGPGALAVVGPDGRVLASSNPEALPPKAPLDAHLDAAAVEAVARALAGEVGQVEPSLSLLRPYLVATPLPQGALVLTQAPASREQLYGSSLLLAAVSLLLFGLFATPVGALFGALRARGLTRRLARLQRAADAWSRGDFRAQAEDRSQDELGELARQLNDMARELRSHVATRQRLAALEERQRIARDLHDSVKQQLFAATLQIGAARLQLERDPGTAERHLGDAEALATEARAELTRLIRALRPAGLERRPFPAALHELARSWAARHGLALEAELPADLVLSEPTEAALYRVAQEALANAARHGRARRVRLGLERRGGHAVMTIEDDGRGFRLARAARRGIGLASMRERLEALGGDLEIVTAPGRGTRIVASAPMRAGTKTEVPIALPDALGGDAAGPGARP